MVRYLTGAAALILVASMPLAARAQEAGAEPPTIETALELFYNGRYGDAAAIANDLCVADEVSALDACELRTSALHFRLRRLIGDVKDKNKAFAQCAECPELLATFAADTRRAQQVARAHLKTNPTDFEVLFFLGRLDLNYVWLQLGTLGRKTGWNEYWEARRSLDAVLKQHPGHIRAKVARAWIDYIVDTKMPFATGWLLGGGSKKKGLQAVREAAVAEADTYVRAEAGFALWDMQVREKKIPDALTTAQMLAEGFPANPELQKFLATHTPPAAVR